MDGGVGVDGESGGIERRGAGVDRPHRRTISRRIKSSLLGLRHRRRAIDALRRTKTPDLLDIDEKELRDRTPGPDETVIASFEAAELKSAIERVSAIHQEVLILFFTQGLSYDETAEVLAVSIGTVKSRLNHARKSLRYELGAKAEERHDR